MIAARVPVPWGPEPKAQIVSGLSRNIRWQSSQITDVPQQVFDDLVDEVDIDVVYKTIPTTPSKRPPQLELPPDFPKWAVDRMSRQIVLPADGKLEVMAAISSALSWLEQAPPSLLEWANSRGIKRYPRPEKIITQDPFTTKTKIVLGRERESQEWADLAPPALLAWAVSKGIKKIPAAQLSTLDPFETRSKVISLNDRRQVMAALKRGEWCLVEEVDVFPPTLRRWLIECKIRFIRWVGGGKVTGGTPVNGYVTEDGVVFYVAEDNSTFYVQEA